MLPLNLIVKQKISDLAMLKNVRFRKKENFFSFLFSLFFYLPSIATVHSLMKKTIHSLKNHETTKEKSREGRGGREVNSKDAETWPGHGKL